MKKIAIYLLLSRGIALLLLVLFFGTAFAQQSIRGTVSDPKGDPVAGANILVKGSTLGTTTDAAGKFIIAAKRGAILVITSVGYQNKELTVGDQTDLKISLAQSTENFAEVVVTALGIKRDKSL